MTKSVAVVLAAGKGTRMQSELPKVAVELLGKPLLVHVLDSLVQAGLGRIIIIVGYKQEVVRRITPAYPGVQIEFAEQKEQRGTADALLSARHALSGFSGQILVTCGDMPAIRPQTFQRLLCAGGEPGKEPYMALLSAKLAVPTGYGRIVRTAGAQVEAIVEEKDATPEIKSIEEVNAGTYVFPAPAIFEIMEQIGSNNAQKEYYLTDTVALSRQAGHTVNAVLMEDASEVLGVNSLVDLTVLAEKLAS
ncbi:MAG: NTP transferase domain-containing protein [Spirochaetales bacterium]|nr:NTP transferase domain-containing protein [Spirochaetales bacterium]